MTKISSKGLVGIALTLSLITSILIYNFLRESTKKPVPSDLVTVVTAKVDIPAKTRITAEMIQEVQLPPEYIQSGAMRGLSQVVGVVARESIVGGEQVLERRLLMAGKPAGFTGVIPVGKRAISVAVSEVTGVAGLLKAGDFVDAIVTFDQQVVGDHVSQILLQNVLVLAVNRESEAPTEADEKKDHSKDPALAKLVTVTLAVSPSEAARVTLAEEKGKLRFALRPFLPEQGMAIQQPITPTDIVGVQKSPLQPEKELTKPSAAVGMEKKSPTESKPAYGIVVIRGTKIE